MKVILIFLIIFFCQNIEPADSSLANTSQPIQRKSFEIGSQEIEKLCDLMSIKVAKKELKRRHKQTNDALKIVSAAALGICGATAYNNFYRNVAKQATKSLNSDRTSIFIVAITAIVALATIIAQYISNKRYSRIEEALKKQSADLERQEDLGIKIFGQAASAAASSDLAYQIVDGLNTQLENISDNIETLGSNSEDLKIFLARPASGKAEANERAIGMTIHQFNDLVRKILEAREQSVVVNFATKLITTTVSSSDLAGYASQQLRDYALRKRPDIGNFKREFVDKRMEAYAIGQIVDILKSGNQRQIDLLNELLLEKGARFKIVVR